MSTKCFYPNESIFEIGVLTFVSIYSPYLGPLLQTRSQKGAISTLTGTKDRDLTKRLLSRSTTTTVVKRLVICNLL